MNHIGGSMGQAVLYTILFLLMLFSTSCESKKKQENEAFQTIANDFASAWNKHDPKAMANFWTNDGDLLSPWEKVYRGKQEIENHFSEEHTNGMKDSHINLTIQNIRFIDSNTAFVDADITISDMKVAGERASPYHNHAAFLFVKKDGKWEILAARPY